MKIIAILILFLGSNAFGHPTNDSSSINLPRTEIQRAEYDFHALKDSLNRTNTRLEFIERENKKQLDFYREQEQIVFWMISFFLIIIAGSFILFGYLYRRPDKIWSKIKASEKKLKNSTKRSSEILKRLEFQLEYQESIFILSKKGLFSFDENDWNLVEVYASNALKTPSKERTSNDWLFIGLSNYRNGNFETSVEAYIQAIEKNNKSEIAWKHLGNAHDELENYNESIKAYKKVLEINENNDVAHNNLGIVYSAQNKFKTSEEHFLKGIALNPDNSFIYTNYFELCLTANKEVKNDLMNTFQKKFFDDKKAMACYRMIAIYYDIVDNKISNLESALTEWKKDYNSSGENESFREIEKWIQSLDDNLKYKGSLEKALNFFKMS